VVVALISAACEAPTPPRAPTIPVTEQPGDEAAAPAKPQRPVPPGQLRREDILAVLSDGPPAFLQRVEVEPVIDRGGRFIGWRVVALHERGWEGGDVHPGDVVRRVNGKSVENPYQFFDVFQSMAFARELRLAIERDGKLQELRYPINDDPAAPAVPRADMAVGAAPPLHPASSAQGPAAPVPAGSSAPPPPAPAPASSGARPSSAR
jgi:hypothetical protein